MDSNKAACAFVSRFASIALLAFIALTNGCSERALPEGSHDAADNIRISEFSDTGPHSPRQLTKEEYDAVKTFIRHAKEKTFETRASDGYAGVVTIDGQQWTIYRDSLYLEHHWQRRLEVEGVSFTNPKGYFTDFSQVIAWAKDK